MEHRSDDEIGTGLRYFGKMSASISHEIKNVMAIINENAGLLEDYIMLAEKGRPIDPERLRVVSERITRQISRADGITRNMNALAHSVDGFVKSVGVVETMELAMGLARRLAEMRNVTLVLQLPSDLPTVITSPFHLQNLIWQVLDFAMDMSGNGKSVKLGFETGPRSVKIRFAGLEGLATASPDAFPTEKEEALIRILNANISKDPNACVLYLELPKDINQEKTEPV